MGPTAVNALMSYNYAGPSAIRSLTLTFFAGLIEIGAGVLNLGTISFCFCILTYISLDLEMLVLSEWHFRPKGCLTEKYIPYLW